jgi:hypothetical protein
MKTGRITVTEEALQQVRLLIGDCLNAAGLVEHSLAAPPLEQSDLESQMVDDRKARLVIWELSEYNFRWELQALNRRLYDRKRFNPLERQEMLLHCFSSLYDGIAGIHFSLARTGLAAPRFADRLPYLQALWMLMDVWPLEKPKSWLFCPKNPVFSPEGDKWERELVRFYAQTFFDHFGRPAVLPLTLSTEDFLNSVN